MMHISLLVQSGICDLLHTFKRFSYQDFPRPAGFCDSTVRNSDVFPIIINLWIVPLTVCLLGEHCEGRVIKPTLSFIAN